MKTNRRSFFKIAGVAGAGVLAGSSFSSCTTGEKGQQPGPFAAIKELADRSHSQVFNMSGFAAPKIDVVRVGVIGLGSRGPGAVERLSKIDGLEIKALCDKLPDRVENAQGILAKTDCLQPKATQDLQKYGKNFVRATSWTLCI